jgi:hypothetical protein
MLASASVSSLVVHIAFATLYLFVIPAVARRLANISHTPHHLFLLPPHLSPGHGLAHSHTFSLATALGVLLSLVFVLSARALRRVASVSLWSTSTRFFRALISPGVLTAIFFSRAFHTPGPWTHLAEMLMRMILPTSTIVQSGNASRCGRFQKMPKHGHCHNHSWPGVRLLRPQNIFADAC